MKDFTEVLAPKRKRIDELNEQVKVLISERRKLQRELKAATDIIKELDPDFQFSIPTEVE